MKTLYWVHSSHVLITQHFIHSKGARQSTAFLAYPFWVVELVREDLLQSLSPDSLKAIRTDEVALVPLRV